MERIFTYTERIIHRIDDKNASFTIVKKECQSDSSKNAAKGMIEGNPTIGAINEPDPSLANTIIDKLAKTLTEKFGAEPMKCQMQAIVVESEK